MEMSGITRNLDLDANHPGGDATTSFLNQPGLSYFFICIFSMSCLMPSEKTMMGSSTGNSSTTGGIWSILTTFTDTFATSIFTGQHRD